MKKYSNFAIPYIVWAAIMLLLPMLLVLFYSLTDSGNTILTFKITLSHFKKFFTDPDFLKVLWKSLVIAIKTTVICFIIGYPTAYFIANSDDKTRNILVLAITIPTWINMLVRTYAWIGILDNVGLMYTETAVIIGMVYNFIPFMILQINTSLCKMDKSLIEAAADLGANRLETFTRVIFPLSLPGVVNGIALVFLPAVSSFFIPKLLGGGQYFLIGNVIENQFITVGEWNFGSAISVIMAVIMMLLMYLVRRIEEKNSTAEERKQVRV